MKVGFISLGCNKNLVDTEKTIAIFQKYGYEVVNDPKKAEIIVINTCGFIQSAKEEAINTILEMAEYKKKNCKYLIVMGCLAQRYKEELEKAIPEVDLYIKYQEYNTLWEQIESVINEQHIENHTALYKNDNFLELTDRVITTGNNYAYLKIADGCSNYCTYCAIPKIRGPLVSRKMENILEEAKQLVQKGYREIILTAQDTTKYGIDIYQKPMLAELLKELCKIKQIKWIRFLYAYPETITDGLIQVVKENSQIYPYFDIPIQHIANPVLKRMNRKSDGASIRNLITKLRKELPNAILRTTVMVGFPGETEEDFEETLDVVRKAKYDSAYTFIYSKRTGTPAAAMENQVPEDVVKNRFNRLLETVNEVSRSISNRYEGTVQQVLVEDVDDHDASYVTGRMTNNILVHFPGSKDLIGTLVNVRLTECRGFYYMGEQENA